MRHEEIEKARVQGVVDDIMEALSLDWLTVVNKFTTKMTDDRIEAETVTDFEYRQASITWSLPLATLETDTALRRVAMHEIVHVLIAPMEDLVHCRDGGPKAKLCELAVENLTRAFMEVLP